MRITKRFGHIQNGNNEERSPETDAESKYALWIAAHPFALIEVNHGTITFANEEACKILHFNQNQLPVLINKLFRENRLNLSAENKGKEYSRHLAATGEEIKLILICTFNKEDALYEIHSPGRLSGTSSPDPFRSLIEQSRDGICLLNQEGIIIEWNKAMSDMYETERESYLNKPVWEFDYDYLPTQRKKPEEKKRIKKIVEEYLTNPEKPDFYAEFEKEIQGKTKYIQYRIFPLKTDQGTFFGRINIDITENKTSQIQLEKNKSALEKLYKNRTLDWEQNEARLRMLVKSVPVAFYSFQRDNRSSIWYSEQIEYLSGYTPDALMQDPGRWESRINEEDRARLKGTFEGLTPNEHISCEYRWMDAHDTEIWIMDQAVLIESTEDHPAQVVGCFMDISERKQAEISIGESEQNYREIFNAAKDSIFIIDSETGIIEDVNKTVLIRFSVSYEEAVNSDISKFSSKKPSFERENLEKKIQQSLKGENVEFEWLARPKNGNEFWVEVVMKTIMINRKIKIMAVVSDINEKKKTEEQLRINEEKYRLLIEGQTDLIIKYDTERRFLFASPSYCDLFDINEEDILGKKYAPLIHENDISPTETAMKRLYAPPYSCYIEQRTNTKMGWRWIAWKNKAILDEEGKVKEILAVGRDMTYQKGVEEALRSSEDRFRSIVQRLSDIILICDPESHIIYDTPTIERILGYKDSFLIGQKLFDIIHQEDIPLAQEKLQQVMEKENTIAKAEVRIKHAKGYYLPVEGTGINMLHHPAIKGIVVTLRDITERIMLDKKILDAVIKTEEQERERFAKNLHDDLGPLLSSIKMYISSLSTSTDPEKQQFIISQLNEVVKEAITTTKEVSNDLSPHILINYGLLSAIENFINKVPSSIQVNLHSDLPSDRYSNTIENSFYRILKELINNSLKHAKADRIDITLKESGQELSLFYADNGKGININKLNPAKNKGMGISNIISRAKSLNGKYQFNSREGEGFSFNITIPIHQPLN